jgi:hypothetical protein
LGDFERIVIEDPADISLKGGRGVRSQGLVPHQKTGDGPPSTRAVVP